MKKALPNKYGAKPAEVDGVRFDSRKEVRRWRELQLLQRAGEISGLERQVTIWLEGKEGPLRSRSGRKLRYVADFSYVDRRSEERVYEDAKGFETAESKLKLAVVRGMGFKVELV